ncbi:MAG TPA: hypothetical protein VEL31_12660 [Ktedonobacteraceae bacterium]|nr:hypothetical protein [Ktedonobacteraceae bacterium]
MSNFNSLERRIDKIEDLIEREWAEPLDAGNMFDLDCFTDDERQAWSSFWQQIGSSFSATNGKSIDLRSWPTEDLLTLKNWVLLYKSRTADSA